MAKITKSADAKFFTVRSNTQEEFAAFIKSNSEKWKRLFRILE